MSRRRWTTATAVTASLLIPLTASAVDYTVSTVAGSANTTSCSTTPTAGTSLGLSFAYSVASDGSGNIYYVDRINSAVCKITPDGNVVRVAGTGTSAAGADNIQATSSSLIVPFSIAVSPSGIIYISDSATGAKSIRKVGLDGVIATILGTSHVSSVSGTGGPAASATTTGASALTVSPTGELYFSDYSTPYVRKIDSNGDVQLVAGNGSALSTGDGGLATSAGVNQITGLAFDPSGNLYLASYYNHIRKIDTSGIITLFAGNYSSTNHSGDGGPASSASFKGLWEIETDAQGDLYIPERGGSTIRKITASTGIVTTIAGLDGTAANVDGLSSAARFNQPFSIAISPSGDIYIGEGVNNRIRKIANAADMNIPSGPTVTFSSFNSYRLTSTINASGGSSGKITFYANGKRIPGCISVTYTGNYTCSWKPTLHGGNTVYASVITSSNKKYSSPTLTVGVAARTNRR